MGLGTTRAEVALVALALVVRAGYFVSHMSSVYFDHPILDALWIHQWASALLEGTAESDGAYFRAPLYPHMIAVVYALAGTKPWSVAVLQHILGALSVGLVYRLGRRVASEAVGIVAALLMGFYWIAIFFEGELLIVTVAMWLALVSLVACAAGADAPVARRRRLLLLGAGVALGLAAIARPTFLVLAPLILLWPFLRSTTRGWRSERDAVSPPSVRPEGGDRSAGGHDAGATQGAGLLEESRSSQGGGRRSTKRKRRRRTSERPRDAAGLMLTAAGIMLPIVPVTARNVIEGGDWVLIASQGGLNLYVGNGPGADGKTAAAPAPVEPLARETYETAFRDNVTLAGRRVAEAARGRPLKGSEVSGYWMEQTWRHVRRAPEQAVALVYRKVLFLINGFEIDDNRDLTRAQAENIWLRSCFVRLTWVLPLVWVGFVFVFKQFRGALFIVFYVLLYGSAVVLFLVNARFRLPLAPGLFILAGIGLVGLAHQIRSRARPRAWTVPMTALAMGAIASNARPYDIDERSGRTAFDLNHAFLLLEGGDCEGAVETYARLHRAKPALLEAAYQLARALERCDRTAEAVEVYRQVIETWPDFPYAYLGLGRSLADAGESKAALSAFRAGLNRFPDVAVLHFGAASAALLGGDHEDAASSYRKGLSLEPSRLSAWMNYGYTLVHLGELIAARRAFERVLALDPAPDVEASARRNLARVDALLNAPPEARGDQGGNQ